MPQIDYGPVIDQMVQEGYSDEEIRGAVQSLQVEEAPADPGFGLGSLLRPVPTVQRAAQGAATAIEGVERPPTRTPAAPGGLVGGLTGIGPIIQAAGAAARAVPALIEQPGATLRGFGAGVVEGLGNLAPLEALGIVSGRRLAAPVIRDVRAGQVLPRGIVRSPKVPGGVPRGPITDPRRLLPSAASPATDPIIGRTVAQEAADRLPGAMRQTEVVRQAPTAMSPRLARPGGTSVMQSTDDVVADALQELRAPARPGIVSQPTSGAGLPATADTAESIARRVTQGLPETVTPGVTTLQGLPARAAQTSAVAPQQVQRAAQAVPEAAPALERAAQSGTLRALDVSEVDDIVRQSEQLADVFSRTTDPRRAAATMADIRRLVGSKEAATLTGVPRSSIQAMGPSRLPVREQRRMLDQQYRRLIKDEKGMSNPELLSVLSGSTLGGVVSAADAENLEDALARGISGALLGGLLGAGGVKGAQMIARSRATGKGAMTARAKQLFETVDTANLLAGPAAIKASLGSLGGATLAISEQVAIGNRAGAIRGLRAMPKMVDDWFHVMKMDDQAFIALRNQISPHLAQTLGTRSGNVVERAANYVSRPFAAGDYAGRRLLERMGLSAQEAATYMLVNQPTSARGAKALDFVNADFLYRMAAKFPRVRINMIERGIEYSPFGLATNTRTAHGAEQLSRGLRRARAGIGTGLTGAGFVYGAERDPGFGESSIVSSMAGPAALPVGLGIAAGKAARSGQSAFTAALDELIQAAPRFTETGRRVEQRFVPGRPLWQSLRSLGIVSTPHPLEP